MKLSIALATLAAALLLAGTARAATPSAKVLAQFDLGFAQCEQRFDHMRGHRDEAFLALYKVKPDDKARARLASLRKSETYQKEHRLALKRMDKSSGPEMEKKLTLQCQATWAEAQRNAPPK